MLNDTGEDVDNNSSSLLLFGLWVNCFINVLNEGLDGGDTPKPSVILGIENG